MRERDTSNLYLHLNETGGRFISPKNAERQHYHPEIPSPFNQEGSHLLAPFKPFFVGPDSLCLRQN